MKLPDRLNTKENLALLSLVAALLFSFVPGCATLDNMLLRTETQPVVVPATTNVSEVVALFTNTVPLVSIRTNFAPVGVVNGVTNWNATVETITNLMVNVSAVTNWNVSVVPAHTNYVVTEVNTNPAVNMLVDVGGALPLPGAGTTAAIIGLLLQSYVASRRKKMVQSLTFGIEDFRRTVTNDSPTPGVSNASAVESLLLDRLSTAQKSAGVEAEVREVLRAEGLSK